METKAKLRTKTAKDIESRIKQAVAWLYDYWKKNNSDASIEVGLPRTVVISHPSKEIDGTFGVPFFLLMLGLMAMKIVKSDYKERRQTFSYEWLNISVLEAGSFDKLASQLRVWMAAERARREGRLRVVEHLASPVTEITVERRGRPANGKPAEEIKCPACEKILPMAEFKNTDGHISAICLKCKDKLGDFDKVNTTIHKPLVTAQLITAPEMSAVYITKSDGMTIIIINGNELHINADVDLRIL